MKPWMLALVGAAPRVQVTQTFTATTTWTAPITTSRIEKASGKGAAGSPGGEYTGYYFKGGVISYYKGGVLQFQGVTGDERIFGNKPADYCDPVSYVPGPGYDASQTCWSHWDEVTEKTTGAAATGFGKTFPGGTGGPAPTTTFNNVPVTPGASYNLNIPAGGSITITYWR